MRILSFGCHPDDVEILCGGTLAKYQQLGHEVLAVILTEMFDERVKEAEEGAKALGIKMKFAGLPIDLAPTMGSVRIFDSIIDEFQPNLIFTHHPGDSHQAHRAVAQMTFAACRKNRASVLLYERAFPGGITNEVFRPQWFVDISSTIKNKLAAIRAHKSQGAEKWVASAAGNARHWGFAIGCKFAEAFEVTKIINLIGDVHDA